MSVHITRIVILYKILSENRQVENADFSDIVDFISPTFINPCFRYTPIVNIENLDLKNPKIFKHLCFSIFTYMVNIENTDV